MSGSKKNNATVFRERFHSRGLLNQSKFHNNDSFSCLPSPQTSCFVSALKSQPLNIHADSPLKDAESSNVSPIYSTPSVSQRKHLLDKGCGSAQLQKLSPSLKQLISTPGLKRVRDAIKDKLETSQLGTSFSLQSDRESPGLTRLRLTPGKPLKEKRQVLVDKHNQTRRNADVLNIGGGVSLWPDMEDMRLNKTEFIQLCTVSVLLVICVCYSFQAIHGSTLSSLDELYSDVRQFSSSHSIDLNSSDLLTTTSLQWHQDFDELIEKTKKTFTIVADDGTPYAFYICSFLYVFGVSVLLYYLLDNMMSVSKLSPNRIKKWVCLLVIIGTWTLNSLRLLCGAFLLESAVEESIHMLSDHQRLLAYYLYNTQTYNHVVGYWTIKYLPPSSPGILNVLGVVQFKTILYYIQYYSVPILTALISPIIKLVLAVLRVYGMIEQDEQLYY